MWIVTINSTILSPTYSRFIGLKIDALGKRGGQVALKLLSILSWVVKRVRVPSKGINASRTEPSVTLCWPQIAHARAWGGVFNKSYQSKQQRKRDNKQSESSWCAFLEKAGNKRAKMVGGEHSQYQLGDGFSLSLSRYNPDRDTNRAENVYLSVWASGRKARWSCFAELFVGTASNW